MSLTQASPTGEREQPGPAAEERSTPPGGTGSPRRWYRRRSVVAGAVLLAAGGAAVGVTRLVGSDPPASTIDSGVPTGLAQVTKGDLSARSMQTGTLGYAGRYKVVNKARGALTSLPDIGAVIQEGEALYRVDGRPILLLSGTTPAYRNLAPGVTGADVRQLNAALVALGYAKRSALNPGSTTFGAQTADAVNRLRRHVGLSATGELQVGEVVFLPGGDTRVTVVNGVVGAMAGTDQVVMETSSAQRQVVVQLKASRQTTVSVGDGVVITMADGRTTPGTVASVSKVAIRDQQGTVTVEVQIKLTKPQETGQLDQAPVQVSIVSASAKNVLSVPVTALLALAGGGYAVEVDTGGARHLVGVEIGLFDDSASRVEVSGAGLAAGQNVVVPAS